VQADSADREAVAKVIIAEGPLDILVVNAGVAVLGDPLEIDPAEVDRLIDVNVRAPYHAAVEAARRMPDGGRIIVIGSVNGDRVPFAGMAAYGLSKSATQGLVRGLARDLGPRGITVNNVQPGPVDTDLNPADGPMKDMMYSVMAIKRHGKPSEIAALVAFLAGPEAGYITGAQHTIDGGFGA
jgi:cyclic-di-GMP-binding biofilm dispersal mediator protein